MTAEEKQNALVLIEVGCRAMAVDKSLAEGVKIFGMTVALLESIGKLNTCEVKEPES